MYHKVFIEAMETVFPPFSNLFQAAENFGKEVESHILLTSGAHNQRNDKISNEVGRGC